MYYDRDIDRKEIDLLIVEGDMIYPVEIRKAKERVRPNKDFDVLKRFGMKVQPWIILCMSDELIQYDRTTWYCPIAAL